MSRNQIALSQLLGVVAVTLALATSIRADEASTNISSSTRPAIKSPQKSETDAKKTARSSDAEIQKAQALVKDALYHEIAGDDASRSSALTRALDLAGDEPTVRWQSGFVLLKKGWLSIDEAAKASQNDPKLRAYFQKRDRMQDTTNGNQALAGWCAERGLAEQARTHYLRTLEFDPDNLPARAALGYRQFAGGWFTKAEIDARISAQAKYVKQMSEWMPKISRMAQGLSSDDPEARSSASETLAANSDLDALPAMEFALSLTSEELALKLVDKLGNWDNPTTTEALLRQAIYSPAETVRHSAADKLTHRQAEEFIPPLLTAMKLPIKRLVWTGLAAGTGFPNQFGSLAYRQLFAQEGKDGLEVQQLTSIYHASATRNGNLQKPLERIALEFRQQRAIDEMSTSIQNWKAQQLNERIMECLQVATGRTVMTTADDWWNWWDEQNETAGAKTTRLLNLQRDITVTDDGYQPMTETSSDWYAPARHHACFAAGTPVQSASGLVAIEKIHIGDLVLSQNPDSGELTFKPVQRTTVRPGAEVFTIETSGTTLHATGGHLFWVAGEGWTKARNLRSGQTLHCANGTVQVSLVTQERQPQQTYNLVVADFNTYFVGAERILTHDVTERKPTRSIVPGLARN